MISFSGFIDLATVGIQQGMLLGIIALGVILPFKILNLPDLTAEGSYTIGAVLCGIMLLNGANFFSATLLGTMAGGTLGICTSLLYSRLQLNSLLAGIIVSTMTYSINLRLMSKPNIGVFNVSNMFNGAFHNIWSQNAIIFVICFAAALILYRFLFTEYGIRMRAVGLNQTLAALQGIIMERYIALCFFIANLLIALAGALAVQLQGYADIGMGVGIIINALAAMMIGQSIIKQNGVFSIIIAPVIGGLIYQQIQVIVLILGLEPSDLKFVTGLIVILMLQMRRKILN
ncbi:MAG: ABC transporter permease [Candidatus Lariskella arthropodorum]